MPLNEFQMHIIADLYKNCKCQNGIGWTHHHVPTCSKPLDKSQFIWEILGIWDPAFPSFPQECRARELGVWRSLRSQAMGRFSGQNFSKFVWRIVANSYQGMVKGSLWGSAWVENVRNPNIEQQNSCLWSLGCWFLDGKVKLLGMPRPSLHLAHSWFHHVS